MDKPKKRLFKGTAKPRFFFDRKIRDTGHTISISVGKLIPKDWLYVRLELVDADETSRTIKVTRLLEAENNAQADTINKGCEPNA